MYSRLTDVNFSWIYFLLWPKSSVERSFMQLNWKTLANVSEGSFQPISHESQNCCVGMRHEFWLNDCYFFWEKLHKLNWRGYNSTGNFFLDPVRLSRKIKYLFFSFIMLLAMNPFCLIFSLIPQPTHTLECIRIIYEDILLAVYFSCNFFSSLLFMPVK